MKSNQLLVGVLILLALITASISYCFFAYLPQKERTTLRKQAYDQCLKEWDNKLNAFTSLLASQTVSGQISTDEGHKAASNFGLQRDLFLTNCSDQIIQEYNR